jgi:hypothetical protein
MWGSVIGIVLAEASAADAVERMAGPAQAGRPAARFAGRTLDQLRIDEQSAGKPWSITRSKGALCFKVRQGERRQQPSERDRPIERSEIAVRDRLRFGADYKVHYEFMVPPGPRSSAPWANIAQIHSTPDPFDAKGIGPVFAVQFNRERMRIVARADSNLKTEKRPRDQWLYADEADLERGRWYRMDFNLRFDPDGDGRVVVRRDGKMLVNYAGAVGYRDLIGPYWKLGIYRRTAPEPLTVCYRGFTIREGAGAAPRR